MHTLLITIDALRKDHLGFYGYDRNTTPFLDKLAEENTVFRNCYSASCHTREAIPSILTGEKPEDCIKGYYRLNAPTIPEKLSEKVETTGITTGCYLTRTENHNRGFDNFYSDYRFGSNLATRQSEYFARIALNKQYRPAEKQEEEIVSGLESEESFVWAHFMDPHAPYNKYSETYFGEEVSSRRLQYLFRKANHLPGLIDESERQQVIDAYDNSLRYLDSQLRRLFSNLPEDVTVLIVGDHGELLGEDGEYEHPKRLSRKLLEVPLIVRNGEDREISESVSTMDIAPTIVQNYDSQIKCDGENLFSDRGNPIKASCSKIWKRTYRTFKQAE